MKWAKEKALIINEMGNSTKKIPVLCYSGMSGIAGATAISIYLQMEDLTKEIGMIYIRKPKEDSHGVLAERNIKIDSLNNLNHFLVFVDDFVSGGSTLDRVAKELKKHTATKLEYICLQKPYSGGDFNNTIELMELKAI